jgi:hypothetical protein
MLAFPDTSLQYEALLPIVFRNKRHGRKCKWGLIAKEHSSIVTASVTNSSETVPN